MTRDKIKKTIFLRQELIQGVLQGSVRGSLLFNIYLNYLFYIAGSNNLFYFAANTTFNACDKDL